jgi:predicted ribosome quality control (RQC) complex YloA/Tae2 family protein
MKIVQFSFPNIMDPIEYKIGKNAQNNFDIIDSGNPNDLWIHAKESSSCHVIVSLPESVRDTLDKKQFGTIIKKGADLCKKNTTSIKTYLNVEFIYTELRNVVKSNIVGMVYPTNVKTICR